MLSGVWRLVPQAQLGRAAWVLSQVIPARALGLALLLTLLTSGIAEAAFPGRPGHLAFVQRDGDPRIDQWYVSTEGKAGSRAGRPPELLCEEVDPRVLCPFALPAFSPDGRRLALGVGVATGPGACEGCKPARRWGLAVGNSDGSTLTALPAFTSSDRDPAWSPDGSELVFTGAVAGQTDLFAVRPDGTGLRRLTDTSVSEVEPAWSRRGTIVYRAGRQLYLVRAAGGPGRRLTRRGGRRPDWAPSGRSLVFDRRGQIFRVNATGRPRLKRLTRRGGTLATWSPDGRRIAFRRTFDIYLMDAGGRRVRRLFDYDDLGDCQARFCAPRDFAWQPVP